MCRGHQAPEVTEELIAGTISAAPAAQTLLPGNPGPSGSVEVTPFAGHQGLWQLERYTVYFLYFLSLFYFLLSFSLSFFKTSFFLMWNIIDLQCFVCFNCTASCCHYGDTCIYFSKLFFPYRLLLYSCRIPCVFQQILLDYLFQKYVYICICIFILLVNANFLIFLACLFPL